MCDIEFVNPTNKKRKTGNVDDPLQPCAHTKKTPIDYTGPQDNPNITKEDYLMPAFSLSLEIHGAQVNH